jgi:lipid-binding SYLF domain-containing protein
MQTRDLSRLVFVLIAAAMLTSIVGQANAQSRPTLDRDARRAYDKLIASVPAARRSARMRSPCSCSKITKAGLIVGGQYGEGVLLQGRRPAGYYSTAGASYGLQAGAQQFGYAMFFMNEGALKALTETDGFEIGVGPSVVVVDEGMGKSLTTITAKGDVYAFIFSQKGLMAGIGLQGNKITRLR